jgi:hypothetical protein
MLGSEPLSAEARAALCDEVVTLRWFGQDATRILDCVSPRAPLQPAKRRRTQQNFAPAIVLYGTKADHDMLASSAEAELKLDRIVHLCIALGLRCPSEHTIKFVCSWWIYVTHSRLQDVSSFDKQNLLFHVKRFFDAVRRRSPDPCSYIEQLPLDPLEFLRDQPLLYSAHYRGDDKPTKPEYPLQVFKSDALQSLPPVGCFHVYAFSPTLEKEGMIEPAVDRYTTCQRWTATLNVIRVHAPIPGYH